MTEIATETQNEAQTKYPLTVGALSGYYAGRAGREAAWEAARTNEDVIAADKADSDAVRLVQDAFYEDSLSILPVGREVDLSFIHYVVRGDAAPSSISIGGVTFGKLTGEHWPDGKPKSKMTSIIGDERVHLLTTVYRGEALPEGLILLGQITGTYYAPITPEAVNWATSGIPGKDKPPTAGVTFRR